MHLPRTLVNREGGASLLLVPELFEDAALGLWLWIGAQPQRDVCRLHRPSYHARHLVGQGVQVRLLSQPGGEGLKRLCGVVLAVVETPVDQLLDPAAQRAEQGRDRKGRSYDG